MNSSPSSVRGFVAVTAAALLACFASSVGAQASGKSEQVRNLNAQLLQLQADQRRAPSASGKTRAAEVIAQRARLMQELIATNAAAAESLAFPASVLAQLAAAFPAAKSQLEQRGSWRGELEYLIEDDVAMRSSRQVFKLHGQSEMLDVNFVGREPPGLRSGRRISVSGIRAGKSVAVSETQLLDANQDGVDASAAGATYPATCAAGGAQSVLSVLVNLPGYTLPAAVTADLVRGALLGNAYTSTANTPDWSIDDFWSQGSDGKTYIDPANTTVVGPILLNKNFNTDATGAAYCDNYALRDAVMLAIDGQVDFKRYSRIQIVMPPNGACGWAGTANVGCRTLSSPGDGTFNASVAWQRADTMTTRLKAVQLGTHEMGHNLGMSHAASRDHGGDALGALADAGTLSEYGDTHSSMGSWNLGFYASSHAADTLGWLAANTNYRVVESAGTYTLQNYEARPAGVKALKVRRGTGNDAWLWIETRQNTGIYSSQLSASLFGGALIHYQDATTGGKSHLADFTTATASFSDPALPAGQTWTDPYSNLSVTVNSVTTGAMTITVNYGGVTCTAAAPTLSVSPASVATEYGKSVGVTVSVKNNSSSGCAAETFNLAASVPSGWSKSLSSAALSVSPGQQAQSSLTVGVPAPNALGTFPVSVSATSAASAKMASANVNVTVTEPVNTLSATPSGGGSIKLSNPVKTCSTACTTDYAGTLSGATVTLTALPPDTRTSFTGWSGACTGTATTCTLTMSADRAVTATFKRSGGGGGGKSPKGNAG